MKLGKDCTGLEAEPQTAQEGLVELGIHCHNCGIKFEKDDEIYVHTKEKENPNPVCHKKCREDLPVPKKSVEDIRYMWEEKDLKENIQGREHTRLGDSDDEKMVDYPVKDENGDFVRFDRMSERQIEALNKMEERLARYPWRSDPPTEKQLSALEYYGYKGPKPRTKGAASDLIEKYKEEEHGF